MNIQIIKIIKSECLDISKPKIWIKLNRRYKLRNLIWVQQQVKNFDGKYLYEKEIYISKRKSSAFCHLI
jgi:hypothetical protein